MTTARRYAENAGHALTRAETETDFAEVQAAALVAIALHLTEPAPDSAADDGQPCCAKSDAGYLCTRAIGHIGQHEADDGERTVDTWLSSFEPPVSTLAEVIWHASRADEGTISATGADVVARAVLSWLKTFGSQSTQAAAETRQPTGLQRLTQPEPLTVTVEPNEWRVTISGKPERFITLTDEGEYATARDATHPTLAAAVAAIIKAAS